MRRRVTKRPESWNPSFAKRTIFINHNMENSAAKIVIDNVPPSVALLSLILIVFVLNWHRPNNRIGQYSKLMNVYLSVSCDF